MRKILSESHEHDATKLNVGINLGGAGKVSGLQLYRANITGKYRNSFRQLFIDTDKTDLERMPKWSKFLMNDFPASAFLRKIAREPQSVPGDGLADRLEEYRKGLGGAESINAGLQTVRQLGWALLSFYQCRYSVELNYFLLTPIRQLHAFVSNRCAQRGQGNIQDKLELNVTLVFSACGGTGSSLGLLLANLLHKIIPERGGFTRYRLDADILLPGPMTHKAVNVVLLLANTFATLKEVLRPYSLDESELPEIQLGTTSMIRRQPFHRIYLYDGINLGGYTFTSREQVCQLRNAVYELRSFGPEAAEYKSRLADIHNEYPRVFSAAGACIWEFDAEYHIRDFGGRIGNAWLSQVMDQPSTSQLQFEVERLVAMLMNQHAGWKQIPHFMTDNTGKPLRVTLSSRKKGMKKVLAQFTSRFDQHKQQWQDTLKELVTDSADTQLAGLLAFIETVINQPSGIATATSLLDALATLLEQQQAQVTAELQEATSQLTQIVAQSQQPANGSWRWFSRSKQSSVQSYQQISDAALNRFRYQAQARYIELLHEEIQAYRQGLISLQDTLGVFGEAVKDVHVRYLERCEKEQSIAVQPVVCPNAADQWYRESEAEVLMSVREQLHIRWMPSIDRFGLLQQTSETKEPCLILSDEAQERYLAICERPWFYLKDISVEEVLRQTGKTPEGVFADLEQAAAPLISAAEEEFIPEPQRLLVLASETEHFFASLPDQTGLTTVVTRNPHRISLLYTIHGLQMEHLMKYRDFKSAYDQAIADGRNLHVYPDMEPKQAPRKPKKRGRKKTTKEVGEPLEVAPETA